MFPKSDMLLVLRGYGGIGRRARFRFWWETVQVQVLLSALLGNKKRSGEPGLFLIGC